MRLIDKIAEGSEFLKDCFLGYIEYKKTEKIVNGYFHRLRRLNSFESSPLPEYVANAMSTVSEFKKNRKIYLRNSKKTA